MAQVILDESTKRILITFESIVRWEASDDAALIRSSIDFPLSSVFGGDPTDAPSRFRLMLFIKFSKSKEKIEDELRRYLVAAGAGFNDFCKNTYCPRKERLNKNIEFLKEKLKEIEFIERALKEESISAEIVEKAAEFSEYIKDIIAFSVFKGFPPGLVLWILIRILDKLCKCDEISEREQPQTA